MDIIDSVLVTILLFLAVLAVAAGLCVLGLMLAGMFDVGPLAHWWMEREAARLCGGRTRGVRCISG